MRASFSIAAASRSAIPKFQFRTRIRCFSSSPLSSPSISTSDSLDHVSFISNVASTKPPEHLSIFLNLLQARGETIVSPGAKEGIIPLVIPLSESPSGVLTSLLRWPTSPSGQFLITPFISSNSVFGSKYFFVEISCRMELPVVEVHKHGVLYLAKSVDQYIHRLLVEEDANDQTTGNLWEAASDIGYKFYKKGDFLESGISDLDVYLLKKVGLFPDVLERKVARHFEKGDQVSALVTGEFYTRNHFPGFGRPFVFNAEVLLKVGRKPEAKDAARGALKSPWWTLGCRYHEVAEIAEWDDEQIEFIKEKVTEDGKLEDLKKGKQPEQVALDEAAFLLDLASIDGNWDEVLVRVANCYVEAGLSKMAKFVLYRE